MEEAQVLRWMAIERIREALQQKTSYERRWSCARLAVDYLQGIVRWAGVLSFEDWPFPDVAATLFPERFAKEQLIKELGGGSIPSLSDSCFAGYVHYCEVEDTPEIRRFGMSNPYEPIIRLYERGGYLSTCHGIFDICTIGIPYTRVVAWPDWQPLATDDATLDAFDEEERKEKRKRE